MPIRATCPGCQRTFRVAEQHAGRRGRCPDCGEIFRLPEADLPEFDPIDDESGNYAEDYAPRRRPASLGRSPADDLSAWRRVSTGYLVQQGGACMNLLGLVLLMASLTVLAEEPGNPDKEPTLGEMIAASFGALAAFVGIILQCIGRFVSAVTPVRAPRALGYITAIGSAIQLPAMCVVGGLVMLVAGNQQDAAAQTIAGLGVFAYLALWVACECVHCFALASVGRVLRAEGLRGFGRGLGVAIIAAGFLIIVSICGFGIWSDANNPNGQNLAAKQTEDQIILAWQVGTGVIVGLYLILDVVLLQHGRSAVARIAELDQDAADEGWR
jgi:hypothetical protein